MSKAGADATILTALDSAKVVVAASAKGAANQDVLEHIANAGKLMQDNNYPDAARELNTVLAASSASPEAGFVMGQLLRKEERWPEAAAVLNEVLQQDPTFPEAHTKLSFVYYRLDQQEDGLREAKAALALTPDNAEAHKNAGLALATMRKFDAHRSSMTRPYVLSPIMLRRIWTWRSCCRTRATGAGASAIPEGLGARSQRRAGALQSGIGVRPYRRFPIEPSRVSRGNPPSSHTLRCEAESGRRPFEPWLRGRSGDRIPRFGKALSRRSNVPPLFGIGTLPNLGPERRRDRVHAGVAIGSF